MQQQNSSFKVVVFGGGLVGSLAAVYFANRGYSVDVYEKRPGLSWIDKDIRKEKHASGRSINLALSVRGIEALKGAGVVDDIFSNVIPMKGRMIHGKEGTLSSQPYGLFGELINELLLSFVEKSPFVNLYFDHAVERCDFDKDEVTVVDSRSNRKVITDADLIIGADGAFSNVRKQMMRYIRMSFSQQYIDHGYVELNMPPRESGDYAMNSNHLHIWPRQTFMLIALPNLDHSFTVTLFMQWEKFDAIKTPNQLLEFFEETFPDALELIGRDLLVQDYFKNPKGSLMSVKCKPYHVKNKAVIIGDAAHAMVPFYGQGMNCGFEDVLIFNEIFSKHLTNSIPTPDQLSRILEEYSEYRNPDAESMCDLALYNYVEMRSSVMKPRYLFRKKVEGFLHKFFPESIIPLYTMVTFSRIRYSEALQRFNRQTVWFLYFQYLLKTSGFATVLGLIYFRKSIAKFLCL